MTDVTLQVAPGAGSSFDGIKKRKKACSFTDESSISKEMAHFGEMLSHLEQSQKLHAILELVSKAGLNADGRWQLRCGLDESLKCNPLDVLPPELGIYIFNFLERKDLTKAALVCSQWKDLAYDRTLLISKIQDGYMYCQNCTSLIAKDEDVLCRKYRLDYSLAYHMKTLLNVEVGKVERAEFSNGIFNIAPTHCRKCKCELGVKYVDYLGLPTNPQNPQNNNPLGAANAGPPTPTSLPNPSLDSQNESKIGSYLLKKKMVMFPGEPQHTVVATCSKCKGHIGKEQNIISWSYRLRGSEAYQFTTLQNVHLGEGKEVSYSSGNYTVADASCGHCLEPLGVKYLEAADGENAYKVGTYLVEKPKVKIISVSMDTLRKPRANSLTSLTSPMDDDRRKQRKSPFLSSIFSFLRASK